MSNELKGKTHILSKNNYLKIHNFNEKKGNKK